MRKHGPQNFRLYLHWRRRNPTFCPWPCDLVISRGQMRGYKAFAETENGRKHITTRHPRVVRAAVEGKRKLNWQIKQWAEGARDGTVPLFELQEAYPQLPTWVWQAVERQAQRKI